jgi:hypothetical protein
MANKAKTYFLVPGWDFPVGSIQLDAVIADPAFPLNEDDLVPTDTKTRLSDKYDFSSTIDKPRATLELPLSPPLELLPRPTPLSKTTTLKREAGRNMDQRVAGACSSQGLALKDTSTLIRRPRYL